MLQYHIRSAGPENARNFSTDLLMLYVFLYATTLFALNTLIYTQLY